MCLANKSSASFLSSPGSASRLHIVTVRSCKAPMWCGRLRLQLWPWDSRKLLWSGSSKDARSFGGSSFTFGGPTTFAHPDHAQRLRELSAATRFHSRKILVRTLGTDSRVIATRGLTNAVRSRSSNEIIRSRRFGAFMVSNNSSSAPRFSLLRAGGH